MKKSSVQKQNPEHAHTQHRSYIFLVLFSWNANLVTVWQFITTEM